MERIIYLLSALVLAGATRIEALLYYTKLPWYIEHYSSSTPRIYRPLAYLFTAAEMQHYTVNCEYIENILVP